MCIRDAKDSIEQQIHLSNFAATNMFYRWKYLTFREFHYEFDVFFLFPYHIITIIR